MPDLELNPIVRPHNRARGYCVRVPYGAVGRVQGEERERERKKKKKRLAGSWLGLFTVMAQSDLMVHGHTVLMIQPGLQHRGRALSVCESVCVCLGGGGDCVCALWD